MPSSPNKIRISGTTILVSLVLSYAMVAWGQMSPYSAPRRSTAGDSTVGAEQEAARLVSLSADKIISILQDEPGLLLQAKKVLVRKAYEQGRILEPEDLTDAALFRLVREDNNIRALITREIEDRAYVRAKPNRQEQEELARELAEAPLRSNAQSQPQTTGQPDQVKARQNQEDAYWSKHDSGLPQSPGRPGAKQSTPNSSSPPDELEQAPPSDPRRQVERTQVQPASPDIFEAPQTDSPMMLRVRPEELPGLLAAGATDPSVTQLGIGMDRIGGGGRSLPTPPSSTDALNGVLSAGVYSGLSLQKPDTLRQEANLDGRYRRQAPVYAFPRQRDEHLTPRHRPDPYADVPSLYDLYSQYSKRPTSLERFGIDVFRNGTGNFDELPMDVPVGPDYVLGPGDGIGIDIWGGVSQRLQRVVDREGRVALPEVGYVEVNGRTLGEVQHLVQTALRTQFRDVQADVSLARVRTVRVYVVGDVERAGAYDVSSLSTPLNAVYMAGGPTSRGSLRFLRQYRGKQLVQEIDVYDLLLHGVRTGVARLQAGDTVLVAPLGPEITIEGMVRRPAVYELGAEKSLSEALELAGGVLPTGTLREINVERLEAHERRTMLRIDVPDTGDKDAVTRQLDAFQVQDGDKIKISPILPYADKTVYLDGHVFRPGKYAYKDGMCITDVIHDYRDLLPEPYKQHAEIIRLNLPDYQPSVLAFNLEDALAGKLLDLTLKPFDTIRVFGRFDFEDPPVITVTGAVRDPGDHVTNGTTYLRDAVYLAGGTTPDAELNDAQVFRHTEDGKLTVISISLGKALAGDAVANVILAPKDRVFIHKSLARTDPQTVMIQGEVARPGKYPLGTDMTASDLVRLAGGLKRSAYTQQADLTRYIPGQGSQIASERMNVPIAAALAGEPDTDVRLRDGDVLTIQQLSGWTDIGAIITVRGEVAHAGSYGIEEGERLSSILRRAGGFRNDAYPYGAILERTQVRDIEERNRADLVRQVQDEGNALRLVNVNDPDEKAAKDAALLQWKSTLEDLEKTPPIGRLVIHISADIDHWAQTPADIQVRAGDVIYIPKKPTFVTVDGAVYNPTAVSYRPGKSAGWYLRQAGGPNNMANKKGVFVIRADGSVAGGPRGVFWGSVLDVALQPGDMIMVPQKAYSGNSHWKNTLQAAQLVQAVGIAIQVARGF